MASPSSRHLTLALGPLEATSTFTTCTFSSSSSLHPSYPRLRRRRRVLFPASQRRRVPLREAPDQAVRWLLIFSALLFLQIYSEETNSCTELQSQSPDPAACQPQEDNGSLGAARGLTREEPWRVQTVGAENQLECVVA